MTASAARIVIIGGGLGGLCLAQGLRRAGLQVEVHERDEAPLVRRQGYRIHLDTRAARGLHQCLPPSLYKLFLATCSAPSTQVTVVTKQLRQLKTIRFPTSEGSDPTVVNTSADRLILRSILLTDLQDVVHFGREFTSFDRRPDGTVVAHFRHGPPVTADVLVAADGADSRVRGQYLPNATLRDLGSRCVLGKMMITRQTCDSIPSVLDHGFAAVVGSRKVGMALGAVRFRTRPDLAAARLYPQASLPAADDYVMWALSGRAEAFPGRGQGLTGLDGAALAQAALDMTADWHPDLRYLVEHSTTDEIFAIPVRSSSPVPPWPTTNVTLLGDAIHAMSPARGSGANVALMDAGNLARHLTLNGTAPLDAIHSYETEMIDYGFTAVRDSLALAREGGGLAAVLATAVDRLRRAD